MWKERKSLAALDIKIAVPYLRRRVKPRKGCQTSSGSDHVTACEEAGWAARPRLHAIWGFHLRPSLLQISRWCVQVETLYAVLDSR